MAPSTSKSLKKGQQRTSLIQGFIEEAGNRLPQYKKQIDAVGPVIVKIADTIDAAYPYGIEGYKKCVQLWELAQPYNPQRYFPLLLGFAMCFFGGSFVTLIAAVEAVRLSIWERLFAGIKILYQNYTIAEAQSKKDDEVDADGNGVADVLEISDRDLLTRKLYVFARSVDPQQVSDASLTIWSAVLAVIATLRIHFAQAITLGTSLGEMAQNHLSSVTQPILQQSLPAELQKWVPVANGFLFKFTGVIAAWFLSRIISGFHAAVRGASLIVTNALILAKEHGIEVFDPQSPKATALSMAVAFLGFYWQLSNGFSIPFPLNLLLLPLTFAEWLLSFLVSFS
eukprot:CAMPEP_0176435046 /NCGR_PEP_ID=MMETSP0127-20121128/17065_1 /TAXON_ID=938130 /ORGANISM="Platyophrya macrostoma, Strain WH" /LENGTH=339 /DNA_ID=CAMNT_0017817951 /DNA_START=44 /DNA_END=1063 /DNA_ORIENTATION=+